LTKFQEPVLDIPVARQRDLRETAAPQKMGVFLIAVTRTRITSRSLMRDIVRKNWILHVINMVYRNVVSRARLVVQKKSPNARVRKKT